MEFAISKVKMKWLSLVALFVMVVGSVGLDQMTKRVAEDRLLLWGSSQNLKEYQGRTIPMYSFGRYGETMPSSAYVEFNFTYVRNQGAAWGLFSDVDDAIRVPFFYMVTLVALCVIFLYLKSTPWHHRLVRFSLMLILSGALGNFLDRILHGYVIDFLDVNWVLPLPFTLDFHWELFNFAVKTDAWRYDFPKFNVADSMITMGVIFLIYDMIFLEPRRKKID